LGSPSVRVPVRVIGSLKKKLDSLIKYLLKVKNWPGDDFLTLA
jgi:hypothetical protein